MNAFQVCDSLVSEVKYSNLNYTLQESPFSITISLKKSFIKNKNGEITPSYSSRKFENSCAKTDSNLLAVNEILRQNLKTFEKENIHLEATTYDLSLKLQKAKVEISDLLFNKKALAEAKEFSASKINALESKLLIVESDSSKEIKTLNAAIKKEIESSKPLKDKVKSLQNEASHHNDEIQSANKMFKAKDKDIYNLERKSDNLNDTIERLKIEVGTLKTEKVKLQKELKNVKKKADKELRKQIPSKSLSSGLSTNTSVQSTSSTSNTPSLLLTLPTLPHSNLLSTATMCSSESSLESTSSISTTSNLNSNLSNSTPSNIQSASPISMPSSATCNPLPPPIDQPNLSNQGSLLSNPIHIHPWHNIPLFLPEHAKCNRICEHPTQCIVRQPRMPPLPSITYLINDRSKYHEHMMTWPADEFAGCWKCFSVDNENYGCKDCQWLKWWLKWHGELHGYPDVSRWLYKKYL